MNTGKDNSYRYSTKVKILKGSLTDIRIEKIISCVAPCRRLLDVGCWDGFLMQRLLSQGKAENVVGVDNSIAAIKLAKKKGLSAMYIDSADEHLPFPKNSFDCVIAGELIEHLYDVNKFLSEVWRVLKTGGQLVISTPNLSSLGNRLELIRGNLPWQVENGLGKGTAGHIRYFNDKELRRFLQNHHFKVTAINADVVALGRNLFIKSDTFTKRWPYLGRILIVSAQKV